MPTCAQARNQPDPTPDPDQASPHHSPTVSDRNLEEEGDPPFPPLPGFGRGSEGLRNSGEPEELEETQEERFAAILGRVLATQLSTLLLPAINRAASAAPEHSDSSRGFKPRDPDTFSGRDRSKLPDFLAQCRIYFLSAPKKFPDDRSKILFIGSHLESPAFDWFRMGFYHDDPDKIPISFRDYPSFIKIMNEYYGEPDAQLRAENELRSLRMEDNHRVHDYVTDFNRLSVQLVDWSDRPLADAFHRGLCGRLRRRIAALDTMRPRELAPLILLAQTLDTNYWEERGAVSEPSEKKSKSKSDSASHSTSSNQKSSVPASSNSNSNSNSASGNKEYSKFLGSNGKLDPAEKERRRVQNLCMYCGHRHSLESCPLRRGNSSGTSAPSSTQTPATSSAKGRAGFTISGPDASATISEVSDQGND